VAAAFLTAACVVGGAAGWALEGWAAGRGRHDRNPDTTVAYLSKQLGLSAGQEDSVRTVFERRRIEMDSIWREVRPRIESLRTAMQVEIEEELTPAQRSRFRELMAWQERQRHAADNANRDMLDMDRDGVPSSVDRCRDTPRGTPVDASGCPVPPVRNGGA
jgi:hypothetical protein